MSAHLLGCGSEDSGAGRAASASSDGGGAAGQDGASGADSVEPPTDTWSSPEDVSEDTTSLDSGGQDAVAEDTVDIPIAWATGGTAAMGAKDAYPNPFTTVDACPLVCQTTAGPCTSDSIDRVDVSEGFTGLPVRLLIRVVDDTCEPLTGAVVTIWHTQRTGVYSGETPGGKFCYVNDVDAVNYLYFRGHQTTDDLGVVAFDTCYPGWYPGRAIHIHFAVTVGGAEHVVSQLFFPDELNTEVFADHEEYVGFGLPDTTNQTDDVIGNDPELSRYTLDYQQMSDGAMLAWKTVAVVSGGPGCTLGSS